MITAPKVEQRDAQPYVGIRTLAATHELPTIIPQLHEVIYGWLEEHGIAPAGASFIRYHVIDMATKMDITIGVPIASVVASNERVTADVIPAGKYATLLYTGDYSGLMDANKTLIDWAEAQGVAWDRWDDEKGDAFAGRYETYLRDPGDEPDPAKYETEVAIKLAEN